MASEVLIYTAYNPPPSVPYVCTGKSLTRQSEAKDCDVNVIMARYEKTGVIPVQSREAFYADVSEMGDYRTAVHQVKMAEEYFGSLPARVRSEFDNDPAAFLDFVSDPENRGKMVELGLLPPETAEEVGPDPGRGPESSEPVEGS